MSVTASTDRSKSVLYRCVNEVLVAILFYHFFVYFSVGKGTSVIGLSQNSSFYIQCTLVNRHIAGVTLKSDPVEKWLPGSLFNVKNDSPGHFSTLKADTCREKVTPPWNFEHQGVIFQRYFNIENKFVYPHKRSSGGILVSQWLPVCLSVKKWFLYNNSSSIWHTMVILHIYVELDLRKTSVDFGSKVKGQRSNLDLLFFVFTNLLPQVEGALSRLCSVLQNGIYL